MIIERLDLKAYGRFTDVSLDFSAGPNRFHLVYGPNESGKSTSLRAITALLYGMPHQAEDAYLHPASKVRVGGLLRGDDGNAIEVIRRRGRQKTLRQSNDADLVDDSILLQMLGGVDLETFKQQFGLSHDELVQGGAAILSGGGDLGAMLFAAGAGISRLHEVQALLSSQAEQLFKRSGKNATLNQAIREYDEKNKKLRELQVPPSEFQRLQDELNQKSDVVAESETLLHGLTSRLTRLRAYRQALPLAQKWKTLKSELLELADVPLLDHAFSERRRGHESQHALKSQMLVNLSQQRAETVAELEKLSGETPAMTYANDIDQLYQNLGAVQKARKDRVGLMRIRHEINRSMADTLRELAVEVPEQDSETHHQIVDDSVRRLQLSDAARATINSLAQSYGGLIQQRDQSEQAIEALRRRLDDVDAELQEIGTPADPETLYRVIEAVGSPDTRLSAFAQQSDDLIRLQRKSDDLLRRLTGFNGTAKQAAMLKLPASGLIDQVSKRIEDADDALSAAKAKLEQLAVEKDDVAQRLRREQKSESLPTTHELEQARQKRNESIDALAHDASAGDVSVQSINQVRSEVLEADQLVDKIRAFGEAVHRREAAQAKLEVINDQILQQQSVVEAALEESSDAIEQWLTLWSNIGVVADSPQRMQRWVADHEQLVEYVSQWQTEATRLEKLEQQVATVCERLRRAIAETRSIASATIASVPDGDRLGGGLFDRELSKDDLVTLYEEAVSLHRSLSESNSRYKQLRQKRDTLRDELPAAAACAETSREKLEQWDCKWEKATSAFVDSADRSPEVIVSLLSKIDTLCKQRKERNILVTRIRSIGEDDKRYCDEVVRMAALRGVNVDVRADDSDGVSELVKGLFGRLQEERIRSQRRDAANMRLSDTDKQMTEIQQQVNDLKIVLNQLCAEAACADVDSLIEVERKALRRRELTASLESVEDQLRILAVGEDLASFVQATLDQDAGLLDAEIRNLESQQREWSKTREAALQDVGALRRDLQRIDGSDEAAVLRQSIQFLAGQIAVQTQQYAQVRMASLILREAIEDYRQQNEGPVLDYAKEFFAGLTCGEYATLRVDHNDKGTPVLVGVRSGPDQQVVRAEDMSTGTADALYLSLRLASLRHQLSHGQTMPLIVDDCLVQLDDARTAAALAALSKLSIKTQVILFTHHDHVIDLARHCLAAGEFHVHTLVGGTLMMP